MGRGKKYQPEQVVNLLRQIEVAVANGNGETIVVTTFPTHAAPGYPLDVTPDLSWPETRERLSQSAMDGFFSIMDKWQIPLEQAGDLLGGVPRSTIYKWKAVARTLR